MSMQALLPEKDQDTHTIVIEITDIYFSKIGKRIKSISLTTVQIKAPTTSNKHMGPVIELKISLQVSEVNLYFQSYSVNPG